MLLAVLLAGQHNFDMYTKNIVMYVLTYSCMFTMYGKEELVRNVHRLVLFASYCESAGHMCMIGMVCDDPPAPTNSLLSV